MLAIRYLISLLFRYPRIYSMIAREREREKGHLFNNYKRKKYYLCHLTESSDIYSAFSTQSFHDP